LTATAATILGQPSLVMGLRFRKSQVRVLRNLIDWIEGNDVPGIDVSLYRKAMEAAAEGEPLLVHCDGREEVEEMAAAFVRLGLARPTIDELAGR